MAMAGARKRSSGKKRNQRACLKCGVAFLSKGAGNRLCKRCNRENSHIPPAAGHYHIVNKHSEG